MWGKFIVHPNWPWELNRHITSKLIFQNWIFFVSIQRLLPSWFGKLFHSIRCVHNICLHWRRILSYTIAAIPTTGRVEVKLKIYTTDINYLLRKKKRKKAFKWYVVCVHREIAGTLARCTSLQRMMRRQMRSQMAKDTDSFRRTASKTLKRLNRMYGVQNQMYLINF